MGQEQCPEQSRRVRPSDQCWNSRRGPTPYIPVAVRPGRTARTTPGECLVVTDKPTKFQTGGLQAHAALKGRNVQVCIRRAGGKLDFVLTAAVSVSLAYPKRRRTKGDEPGPVRQP